MLRSNWLRWVVSSLLRAGSSLCSSAPVRRVASAREFLSPVEMSSIPIWRRLKSPLEWFKIEGAFSFANDFSIFCSMWSSDRFSYFCICCCSSCVWVISSTLKTIPIKSPFISKRGEPLMETTILYFSPVSREHYIFNRFKRFFYDVDGHLIFRENIAIGTLNTPVSIIYRAI